MGLFWPEPSHSFRKTRNRFDGWLTDVDGVPCWEPPFLGLDSGLLYAIIGIALIGASAGSISGVSVQWLNIPPLVMTLVIATVIDGLVLAITKGAAFGQYSTDTAGP